MNHIKQKYAVSCAAASMAMIAGITEDDAIELCDTNNNGTATSNVKKALDKLGFTTHWCHIDADFKDCWWLERQKYPTFVAGFFKAKYHKRGRPRERHHAFVVKDGYIYDPSNDKPFPFDAYSHIFDSLHINSIIIAEKC